MFIAYTVHYAVNGDSHFSLILERKDEPVGFSSRRKIFVQVGTSRVCKAHCCRYYMVWCGSMLIARSLTRRPLERREEEERERERERERGIEGGGTCVLSCGGSGGDERDRRLPALVP